MFGTIVSATDPVAVVALLKELGAAKELGHIIEGESLLNDGTAIVFFTVLIEITASTNWLENNSLLSVLYRFLYMAGVGALLGVVVGRAGE